MEKPQPEIFKGWWQGEHTCTAGWRVPSQQLFRFSLHALLHACSMAMLQAGVVYAYERALQRAPFDPHTVSCLVAEAYLMGQMIWSC